MMRMGKTGIVVAPFILAAAAWAGLSFAGEGAGIGPDQALQKLLDGNRRFVENRMTLPKSSDAPAREKLVKGQSPYAIVLSCSDSRVPPEVVFDQGLGDIFVVRVAGNVPDPIVLGSIEYGVEHLKAPLIVVLGHKRCGAVTAAVESEGTPEGNIGAIVREIAPAVAQARKEATGKDKAALVETAVVDNVKRVAASLTHQSAVLHECAKEGKVKIVPAEYDLDTGKVALIKDANEPGTTASVAR